MKPRSLRSIYVARDLWSPLRGDNADRKQMRSTAVADKCIKRAVKAFKQACPHLLINDKPLANEELEF